MKTLSSIRQRLVPNGQTCPRFEGTGNNIARAYQQLHEQLEPLGIAPMLEVQEIDDATFKAEPSASNRILIAGQPMENGSMLR